MVSSGMLRRVALVRTDVSEEPGAAFIRVTKIGQLGTTQAATSNRRTLRRSSSRFLLVTLRGRKPLELNIMFHGRSESHGGPVSLRMRRNVVSPSSYTRDTD
jgi:hypothetical protein